MPPIKRRTRRKDVLAAENTPDVDLDSSPSRRSVKKRRVTQTQPPAPDPAESHEVDAAPAPGQEQENTGDGGDDETATAADQSDLVDAVIASLGVANHPVAVLNQHSNALAHRGHESVKAYAKIAGRDWTFFVKSLRVSIGRPPDRDHREPASMDGGSADAVDIDLGPNKFVSRLHAEVTYDGDQACWQLWVNGRNGARINNNILKRGATAALRCGDVIDIAGTQMMFVTPGDPATIDSAFVARAQLEGQSLPSTSVAAPAQGDLVSQTHMQMQMQMQMPMSIQAQTPRQTRRDDTATAGQIITPTGRRPGTPRPLSSTTVDANTSVKQSSPLYNRGMMMESTEEIDYASNAAKDIKPPFSYAVLIAQAIFSSPEEKMTLNQIYTWIMSKYAFYRHSQSGWQNSIRHNLSLNKAFNKVPRRSDEPGKGMKWEIVPEYKDEYRNKQHRRGPNSSAPSSPAKEAHQRAAATTAAEPSPTRPPLLSGGHPSSGLDSPGLHPAFTLRPSEAFTPDRGSRPARFNTAASAVDDDIGSSPLPIRAQTTITRNTRGRDIGGGMLGQPQLVGNDSPLRLRPDPRSPTAPSPSPYLDDPLLGAPTPGPNAQVGRPGGLGLGLMTSGSGGSSLVSSTSMLTPAPQRQQPRLAPPSTAQVPSKFMPLSSPAQFWKFADLGMTPGRESSPLKFAGARFGRGADGDEGDGEPGGDDDGDNTNEDGGENENGDDQGNADYNDRVPPSSSPPPALASPIRRREVGGNFGDEGLDPLRLRPVIGSRGRAESTALDLGLGMGLGPDKSGGLARGKGSVSVPGRDEDGEDHESGGPEGEESGFDLARGFQSIGSYHSQIGSATHASS